MSGSLSAVSWFDGTYHIRVFRCKGHALTEQVWDGDGPWSEGDLSVEGTSVSATSWMGSGGVHLRVYAASGGNIVEHGWDGDGWFVGGLSAQGKNATATSWTDEGGAFHIRVYVRDDEGDIQEHCWDGDGPWIVGAYQKA